jgi:uncharacterized protein (DUF427 family)
VWDYPRPPRVERSERPVKVIADGVVVAESTDALRVLETAGAPTIYVPLLHVKMRFLAPSPGRTTYCEWKGRASYFDIGTARRAAWMYPDPKSEYEMLRGYVSFYPAKVECYLGDERARPQPGRFYGGWVTDDIVGPFKGERGSARW